MFQVGRIGAMRTPAQFEPLVIGTSLSILRKYVDCGRSTGDDRTVGIRPKQALQQPLDGLPTQKLCSMGKDAAELSNLEAKVIRSLESSDNCPSR
jgi:hypothetical protein